MFINERCYQGLPIYCLQLEIIHACSIHFQRQFSYENKLLYLNTFYSSFSSYFLLYRNSQATVYFTSVYFNLGVCFFDKMRMFNVGVTNKPQSLDIRICSFPIKVIAGLYFMYVSSEFMWATSNNKYDCTNLYKYEQQLASSIWRHTSWTCVLCNRIWPIGTLMRRC